MQWTRSDKCPVYGSTNVTNYSPAKDRPGPAAGWLTDQEASKGARERDRPSKVTPRGPGRPGNSKHRVHLADLEDEVSLATPNIEYAQGTRMPFSRVHPYGLRRVTPPRVHPYTSRTRSAG